MPDALTISKKLKAAGFTEKQAETPAEIEVKRQHHLATKADIRELKERLDQTDKRFDQVDKRFDQTTRILMWTIGIAVAIFIASLEFL